MKRISTHPVLAISAVFFVLAFAACQKKQVAQQPPADPYAGEITVRLLTDATGVDDRSFNAAGWRGILEFYGDTWNDTPKRGHLYDWVTAQTHDMFVPNLRQATDEGYDLIAVTGFTWAGPLTQVATDTPSQKYLLVDVALGGYSGTNIMQATYAEHQGSFLVGAAAAMKAQEDGIDGPRFGFIGGVPDPVITKFEVGYIQGVLSVIPDAQFIDYYVNSWGEPALAKIQAKNWYSSDVYAIYSAAGQSGNGAIAQAKENRIAGQNVWAIGVDSDQYEEGLYNATESAVLTSMLKLVENSLVYSLNAVKNNTFTGEVINFDLGKGGVGYSTTNPALNESITSRLETIRQQIISGEITIAETYAEAKKLPGFPQDLKAIDG